MPVKKPENLTELFEFYYRDFKPLYNVLQGLNEPPVEMLFEINAALDHLSRHWKHGISEQEVVNAACAHLKRGCFDAFKLTVADTVDHSNELKKIDTSVIDNGEYDAKMRKLISDIRAGANEARLAEGDSRDLKSWHKAYELWTPVFDLCYEFDRDFYLNSNVEWAKRKERWKSLRQRAQGIVIGIVSTLLVALLFWLCGG